MVAARWFGVAGGVVAVASRARDDINFYLQDGRGREGARKGRRVGRCWDTFSAVNQAVGSHSSAGPLDQRGKYKGTHGRRR